MLEVVDMLFSESNGYTSTNDKVHTGFTGFTELGLHGLMRDYMRLHVLDKERNRVAMTDILSQTLSEAIPNG